MSKYKNNGVQESFLSIDINALEQEWVEQPNLYRRWAEKLAKARRVLDELENTLSVVEAELDKAIRDEPEEFKLNKVTETTVKNCVLIQDKYQEAAKEVREAKYNVNMVQASVIALDHRKKALENAVTLWSQSYFATPRAPDDENTRDALKEAKTRSARQKLATRKRD